MTRQLMILTCLLALTACDTAAVKPTESTGTPTVNFAGAGVDRHIMTLSEQYSPLDERNRQVAAIQAAFSRRTTTKRAGQLAALCFSKTLGTPLMPFDLAEIALAETGGNYLSGQAVSPRGALGVWQLMPERARSHGYTPHEMTVDEKCAEAAVRELLSKLDRAQGRLDRAKQLYCGQGPQAVAYLKKIKRFRREMTAHLKQSDVLLSMAEPQTVIR